MNDFTDFSGSEKKLFIQHFSNKQLQMKRLKLEVLAWLMVLGSCKNVFTQWQICCFTGGEISDLISSREQGSLGISV